MGVYWNLLARILVIITMVSGVYFWWVENTHQMAYFLLMTLLLENSLDKD